MATPRIFVSHSHNALRIGLKYGLILSAVGLLVILGGALLNSEIQESIQIGDGYVGVLGLVRIAVLLLLCLPLGFLPTRATGTMQSAFVAWIVFWFLLNAGFVILPVFTVGPGIELYFLQLQYLLFPFLVGLLLLGVPTLFLVTISAFIGRWTAHRNVRGTRTLGTILRPVLALLGAALMGLAIWTYGGLYATFNGFGITPYSAFYPVVFQLAQWWSGNASSLVSVVIILQLQCVFVLLAGLTLFVAALSWRGMKEDATPLRWYRRLFSDGILAIAFIVALIILIDTALSNVLVVTFQPVPDCIGCTVPRFPPPVLSFFEAYPFQSVAVVVASVLVSLAGFSIARAAPRRLAGRRLLQAMRLAQLLQIGAVLAIAGIGMVALWLFPYS